jgi:hypothetical protein
MKFRIFTPAPIIFLALIMFVSCAFASQSPVPNARLGMNLSGPSDWNTELPFVDIFHFEREWISQKLGAGWGEGPKLALDAHGWVRRLDPGCSAETILCTIDGGHYPSGAYAVLYDGKGRLNYGGAASLISSVSGRDMVKVDASKGSIFLSILETDPKDYVRNIRVIMPGYENTYQSNPFNLIFLKRWKGVSCFRFMDWMQTNGSKVKKWIDRPMMADASYTTKGIPLELMIDLCSREKADAWFCMPAHADDNYVRSFAELVRRKLAPGLKVYIEYSNEVWNSGFEQNHYAQEKAKELSIGHADRPWEGAALYYARRAVEIFKIWTDVFGGHSRIVRVLAWQAAADPYWTDGLLLSQPGIAANTDALAIAPYITMIVPAASTDAKALTAETVSKWTVSQVMDHVENAALPESIGWMERQKRIADKYGLKLLAYESGQHLVGVMGGENNDAMTKLFMEANANPRMGDIYSKYYDAWTKTGGDLLCYFCSTSSWSKWGSWGILQYSDDNPSKSPKYLAAIRWAKSRGQAMSVVTANEQLKN